MRYGDSFDIESLLGGLEQLGFELKGRLCIDTPFGQGHRRSGVG